MPDAQWCFTANKEYPPESVWVWTSDGEAVRKGKWLWDWKPPHRPLEEGAWTDEHGNPIRVTCWLPLEESPSFPPQPPPPGPPPSRSPWLQ